MYNSILLNIKQQQYNRYCQAFNFFQSKSINMIIGSRKIDYVVHYRDLQILDDQTQYFKRYYSMKETASRILKLINYYEVNMTPPSPNLILINTFNILEHRKKKLIKLIIMREKQLAKASQVQESNRSAFMILSELDQSNFSNFSSQREQNSDRDSYDSEPFCAYQVDQDNSNEQIAHNSSRELNTVNLRNVKESNLIMDFKGQESPKINVLPPAPPIPFRRQVITNTVSVKIDLVEALPPRILEREPQNSKHVKIPELKIDPLISQIDRRSNIRNGNAMLTDSIEIVPRQEEKEKGKGSTFMDYYNSQPKKAPSNILQKYLKRKK